MTETKNKTDELVFLPLGGSNEIGMNLNAYGFGPEGDKKWIVVDVGVTFAGEEGIPGVDLILPDPEFLALRNSVDSIPVNNRQSWPLRLTSAQSRLLSLTSPGWGVGESGEDDDAPLLANGKEG